MPCFLIYWFLSSASSSLLLNPNSAFFTSVLYSPVLWLLFGTFLYFLFLCWSSQCVPLFLSWVWYLCTKWYFYTITLNFLLYNISNSLFSELLSYSFVWNTLLCFFILLDSLCCVYALAETTISQTLKGVALCRRFALWLNTVIALHCLSDLCNFPSSLFYFY